MGPSASNVVARYLQAAAFNWKDFAKELAEALRTKIKVPLKGLQGEEFPGVIRIDTMWGRDYDEQKGWDDDRLEDVIMVVAKKHGLTGTLSYRLRTPDGKNLEVGVMASSSGGNPTRF